MSNSIPLPRYVMLEHQWNGVHYDLMLECQGMLRTWKLMEPLTSGEQKATELPLHRLAYLEYEGPVSQCRGTVKCIAAGNYEGDAGLEVEINLQLTGTLQGIVQLLHVQSSTWKLIWLPDSEQGLDLCEG
ncbi:MAG: hypothetical protein JNJ77_17395 [Planctomycetia bacterium]|nr:hypothetical protein [Planctomycetia bacterium]